MALALVALSDQDDRITWRWTRDGKHTVSSAYDVQFRGAYARFPTNRVWKCIAEPKVKFSLWMVLHDKILTADNMLKKIGLVMCLALCFYINETTTHLLTQV
jgi:hypothetical protein